MDEVALTLRLALAVLLTATALRTRRPTPRAAQHLDGTAMGKGRVGERRRIFAVALKTVALALALFLAAGLLTSWAAALMLVFCAFAIFVRPVSPAPAIMRMPPLGFVGAAASVCICAIGPGLYSADSFLGLGAGPIQPLFILMASTLALLIVAPFVITQCAEARTTEDSEAAVRHFLPN